MFKLLILTIYSTFAISGEVEIPITLIKQYEVKLNLKYKNFSNQKKSQLYLHAASLMLEKQSLKGALYLAKQAFPLGNLEEKLHSCIIQSEASFRIDNELINESCLDSFKFEDSKKYPILYSDILRLRLLRSDQISKNVLKAAERVFLITEGLEKILSIHDTKIHLKNRNFSEALQLIDKNSPPNMMVIDKVARDMIAWLSGERKDFACSDDLKEYGAHYTEALSVCGELHKIGKVDKSVVEKFAKTLNQEDSLVQMTIQEFLN